MKKFTVPAGFSVSTWAAEPMLGNPVAFTMDDQGRAFIAESFRYRTSTLDIRHYMFMLEDDLASRSTDDRIAYTKKNFPNDWQKLELETEVVRLVQDKDGDGKAETSSEYAADMRTILDGINSGVLAYRGKVWVTNMPNLWLFSGITADGKAEKREILSSGYGVRFSFTGHDMHGLALGPDGRLYFSFGDRGAHVVTKEGKTLAFPDEGAVFRCEPDGSNMEVFCHGLRNPQELAFDDLGNLFTGDNDSDQGDRERWVYLVEGADYGWRIGWQHNPLGKEFNPWMSEKMWEPRKEGVTPAYLLSPIMNIPDGPSGVAYYPGTGLPDSYRGTFFVCGFKGSSARSAVAAWKVKPSGAGFVQDGEQSTFIGSVQSTDIAFGPDSKMYFSEWGEGWEGTGRGRIFKMEHAEALQHQASQVAEVKQLLNEGFEKRSPEELAKLLAHGDQRIRLRAQWALAERAVSPEGKVNAEAGKILQKIALEGAEGAQRKLSRLHAVWGLGQVLRQYLRHTPAAEGLPAPDPQGLALLNDPDSEVRTQMLGILGDAPAKFSAGMMKVVTPLLADENPRVRFAAAQALAKRGDGTAAEAVLKLVRENADKDEYLRHAAVMVLASDAGKPTRAAAKSDESASVRLVVLLAARKVGSDEVVGFLDDKEPTVAREAARAINDVPITAGYPALAAKLSQAAPELAKDPIFQLRAMNAAYRAGGADHATALAKYAASDAPEALRIEALTLLAEWAKPAARDHVAGTFRPLKARDAAPAVSAISAVLPQLLGSKSEKLALKTLDAVAALGAKDVSAHLVPLVGNRDLSPKVRVQALRTLSGFQDAGLSEAIKVALADANPALRVEAVTLLGKLNPDEAAAQLSKSFTTAAVAEKKTILTSLGALKSAAADQALNGLLDDLMAGKIPGEVQLELLEAAEKREAPELQTKLAAYQDKLPKGDLLAAFAPTLVGGNAAEGERIFKEHAVGQCLRCHKVAGSGGDAGPDLAGIGAKKDRNYLLQSIILPNAQIAEGFQSVLVTLNNGEMQMGIPKGESDAELTLQPPVAGAAAVKVKKADIKSRESGPSGMPPGFDQLLKKREIRDLVEYLASLK